MRTPLILLALLPACAGAPTLDQSFGGSAALTTIVTPVHLELPWQAWDPGYGAPDPFLRMASEIPCVREPYIQDCDADTIPTTLETPPVRDSFAVDFDSDGLEVARFDSFVDGCGTGSFSIEVLDDDQAEQGGAQSIVATETSLACDAYGELSGERTVDLGGGATLRLRLGDAY